MGGDVLCKTLVTNSIIFKNLIEIGGKTEPRKSPEGNLQTTEDR